MAGIKLRVHCQDHFGPEDLIRAVDCDVFLVREVGEHGRPHYQGLIYAEPTKEALKALRYRLKARLKLSGNRAYSVAEAPEPDGYIQYLCKGADKDTPPEVLSNARDLDIEAGHAAYWERHAQLIEENPKGYKRKSVWSVLQSECDAGMSPAKIYVRAFQLYTEAGKIPARNTIKNMVFGIRGRDPSVLERLAALDCKDL